MKGSAKVIEELNKALREELTAINQYFLHAEMCENWGYEKLSEYIKKQSIGEMKHAEALMERILFPGWFAKHAAAGTDRRQEREGHAAERSRSRTWRGEGIQRGHSGGRRGEGQRLARPVCATAER